MSPRDGYQGESEEGDGVPRRLTDEQIEQLLAGRPVLDAPEVSELVAHLAAFADAEIDPEVASAHIAAAATAAAAMESPITGDAPSHGRAARLRRRLAFSGFLSSIAAKVLLGTTVALATTAGAAAAGILPDPLQSVAADAASIVGIHIPDPDDIVTVAPSSTTSTSTSTTTIPADDTPGQTAVETDVDQPAETDDTTTTIPSSDDSEQPGEDDEQESLDLEAPLIALIGDHEWSGTACDGSPLSVSYRITEDGELELIGTTPGAQIATDSHGFTAEFDDLDVEIELERSGDEWRLRERADRSCGGDDQATEESNGDSGDDTSGDSEQTSGDDGSGDSEQTSGDDGSGDDDSDKDGGGNGSDDGGDGDGSHDGGDGDGSHDND